MRRFWLSLALAMLGAASVGAFSTVYAINSTWDTIQQAIQVEGDLSFSQLIPGHQYSRNFTVRWAVPAESLQGLSDERVVVHILAYTPASSWIRFRHESQVYKSLAFDLTCVVQNGGCGPGSQLNQPVQLSVFVPENATAHAESVLFNASLTQSYRSELESGDLFSMVAAQAQIIQDQLFAQAGIATTAPVIGVPPMAYPAVTLQPGQNAQTQNKTQPNPGQNQRGDNSVQTSATTGQVVQNQVIAQGQVPQFEQRQTNSTASSTSEKAAPITGFLPAEYKDVIFVVGILAIVGLLLILGRIFPEKAKGLEK